MALARVGLLWRGGRGGPVSERADAMLGPLLPLFAELDLDARHVVYADDAIEEVRAELMGLDGVLVWVNPVQDGATRAALDVLLREVAQAGVWVSAHPDVIDAMGTKEVLYTTRDLGWGGDIELYRSPDELAARFPVRLGARGRLVVKQARGTGGQGVWRVELAGDEAPRRPSPETLVLVQRSEPRNVTPLEPTTLGTFLADCRSYFAWSGSLIDQPYQPRLAEGMVRVYFVHDEVVGFCHQWPQGLLSPDTATPAAEPAGRPPMEDPDTPEYAELREKAEAEWVPRMARLIGLSPNELPVIWDADFLYGPKTDSGQDTFVLCEINVQAVWPFPPQASARLVQAARDRIIEAKRALG